jgi:hypothetical protein
LADLTGSSARVYVCLTRFAAVFRNRRAASTFLAPSEVRTSCGVRRSFSDGRVGLARFADHATDACSLNRSYPNRISRWGHKNYNMHDNTSIITTNIMVAAATTTAIGIGAIGTATVPMAGRLSAASPSVRSGTAHSRQA